MKVMLDSPVAAEEGTTNESVSGQRRFQLQQPASRERIVCSTVTRAARLADQSVKAHHSLTRLTYI